MARVRLSGYMWAALLVVAEALLAWRRSLDTDGARRISPGVLVEIPHL